MAEAELGELKKDAQEFSANMFVDGDENEGESDLNNEMEEEQFFLFFSHFLIKCISE